MYVFERVQRKIFYSIVSSSFLDSFSSRALLMRTNACENIYIYINICEKRTLQNRIRHYGGIEKRGHNRLWYTRDHRRANGYIVTVRDPTYSFVCTCSRGIEKRMTSGFSTWAETINDYLY